MSKKTISYPDSGGAYLLGIVRSVTCSSSYGGIVHVILVAFKQVFAFSKFPYSTERLIRHKQRFV